MRSESRRDAARPAGLWIDVGLAAVLSGTGQLELSAEGQAGWHGLLPGLLLLAQTVPVAFRRPVPVVATVAGAAALVAEALLTGPTNTLSGLLAGLLLLYGVGRRAAGLPMVVATLASAAALALHMLLLPGWQTPDLAFGVIFSAAAWLAGRAVRRREQERRRAESDAEAARRAAAAALETAVVDERTRIARELHDVIAHGMGVMVVQAAAAEQLLELDPEAAREPLRTVRQTGQGALAEMRRLLDLLRDGGEQDPAAPQPGLAGLPPLVERLRAAGLPVTLRVSGEPVSLPAGLQLCAYRIVQEALTNVLKHAAGAVTEIAVEHRGSSVLLRVHNLPGRPTASSVTDGAGHGLIGMRERAGVYEGTVTASARPDGSFLVEAVLPVPA